MSIFHRAGLPVSEKGKGKGQTGERGLERERRRGREEKSGEGRRSPKQNFITIPLVVVQGDNAHVVYSIADHDDDETGTGSDVVRVNSTSGEVTAASRFDRESTGTLSVRVLAVDSGRPSRTGYTSVNIQVEDADDHRPTFSQPTCVLIHNQVLYQLGLSPPKEVIRLTEVIWEQAASPPLAAHPLIAPVQP